MEIRILGSVEVSRGEEVLEVGGANARTLLALLALHVDEVVPIERMIDVLWAHEPPATANAQVYSYVSGLRRLLTRVLPQRSSRRPIVTRPGGYVLSVQSGELDLDMFEGRYAMARDAMTAGEPARARDVLAHALALWRGPALGDAAPRLPAEASRLEERRLAALDDRIEADLALGHYPDLIAELRALVATYPFREGLLGQLMRALYGAGRQAEALEAFATGRRLLVEELGVEPGARLREIHAAILSERDDQLTVRSARAEERTRVDQTPADSPDFTGRAKEVDRLVAALGPDAAGRPPICVLGGQAGVGKTALAVRVAHRLGGEFADGVLYVDLLGADPQPLDPISVLGRFLRALGLTGSLIPETLDERAALWRSRLAEHHLLVVLDNAADERQVRPLLPGRSRSAVLVTSRSRLAGLDATTRVDLDAFGDDQATELLARIVGPDRSGLEPEATRLLVQQCGRLPLALRVAGARLVMNPHWPISALVERLADEGSRLGELAAADHAVRASLLSSYTSLDEPQRRLFRYLGLLDLPDFPAWAGAALLDVPLARAEDLLGSLVQAYLLETDVDSAGQIRYRLHDLLRLLARERAQADVPAAEAAEAQRRVLSGWTWLSGRAERRLTGGFVPALGMPLPTWNPGAELADRLLAGVLTWLEAERVALCSAIRQAAAIGEAGLAGELAATLGTFFEFRGLFDDWRETHRVALAAARRVGDARAEGAVLRSLGDLLHSQDLNEEAITCYERSAVVFAELGDQYNRAFCLCGLGHIHRLQGRHQLARKCFEEAVTLALDLGRPDAESQARQGLGVVCLDQNQLDEAQECFDRAHALARDNDLRWAEVRPIMGLGLLHLRRGELERAEQLLTLARTASRGMGNWLSENRAIGQLAQVKVARGEYGEAVALSAYSLPNHRRAGDLFNVAYTLRAMAEAELLAGDLTAARRHVTEALNTWERLDMPLWRARTMVTVGDVYAGEGDLATAHDLWRQALDTFDRLEAPDADDVRRRLHAAPLPE